MAAEKTPISDEKFEGLLKTVSSGSCKEDIDLSDAGLIVATHKKDKKFDDKRFHDLLKAMQANASIKSFDLSSGKIGGCIGSGGVIALLSNKKILENVKSLNISRGAGSDLLPGQEEITDKLVARLIAETSIEFLDVSGNPEVGKNIRLLSEALKNNHSLQSINVENTAVSQDSLNQSIQGLGKTLTISGVNGTSIVIIRPSNIVEEARAEHHNGDPDKNKNGGSRGSRNGDKKRNSKENCIVM